MNTGSDHEEPCAAGHAGTCAGTCLRLLAREGRQVDAPEAAGAG